MTGENSELGLGKRWDEMRGRKSGGIIMEILR
jgi:hypothetical protein